MVLNRIIPTDVIMFNTINVQFVNIGRAIYLICN